MHPVITSITYIYSCLYHILLSTAFKSPFLIGLSYVTKFWPTLPRWQTHAFTEFKARERARYHRRLGRRRSQNDLRPPKKIKGEIFWS